MALVGNKVDLEGQRQVSFEEAEKKAKEFGAVVFRETSAKSGMNIDLIFEDIARKLTTAPFSTMGGGGGAGGVVLDNPETGSKKEGCAC